MRENKLKNKNTKTKLLDSFDLHFWPAKINSKFNQTYADVPYVSVNDFDSHMIAFFFGEVDEKGDVILPEVPSLNPDTRDEQNGSMRNMAITLNYEEFSKIYKNFTKDDDFDLLKVNYFLSDFNQIKSSKDKGGYTYWFVSSVSPAIDQSTGEIGQITYYLTLDAASTYYNVWWNYSGVVNILRLHNRRWIPDNLFGTPKLIADFQSNRFLQNCNLSCERLDRKFQRSQTTPMLSSRYWDPNTSLPIETEWVKWDKIAADAAIKSKKLFILLWCMRTDQFEAARGTTATGNGDAYSVYQGDVTNLDGYSVPMRLFVYIPSTDSGIPIQQELNDIITQIQVNGVKVGTEWDNETKSLNKETQDDTPKPTPGTYRIVNANISEDLWEDGTFIKVLDKGSSVVPNLYRPDEEKNNGVMKYYAQEDRKEYFYFLDGQNVLWPAMFKTPEEIVSITELDQENYSVEPHVYTNKHFETNISTFNKNSISFDISNLLINKIQEDYERPKVFGGDETFYTFQLLVKKGAVSPNNYDIKYYLLDNDTSVAYKRDNNVLYTQISGDYSWAFYDNTYNENLRTTANYRQAGLTNIENTFKAGQYSRDLGIGNSILGGVLGGASAGAATAIHANLKGKQFGGTILGGIGIAGAASLAGGLFNWYDQTYQLETQRDNAKRSIYAEYQDSKYKPGNINGGSPLTTQSDIRFGLQKDDDYDPKNAKWLWTPSVTFQQLLPYDCYTIAIDMNRNGYQQDRWISINSFNDLMIRKFWNVVSLGNPLELFAKDTIQPEYVADFVLRLGNPDGVRFWNLATNKWDDIYDYRKHNYEKEFDASIMTLESKVYG